MGDLLALAAELVDVASPSRGESALADRVEELLTPIAGLEVTRLGDNVVARTDRRRPQRLLLGGHLDTVPPVEAAPARARVADGVLSGRGSTDMKGGIAVMLGLAAALGEPPIDCTFVFYAREEISHVESGLLELAAGRPDLLAADTAVLLEPTAAAVEAGCQGIVRLGATLGGVRAHTARPWTGRNAIHRLAPVLELADGFPERQPVIDGCEYHETLQAVSVGGGGLGNVVPAAAEVVLSHRFAPDRDAQAAFASVAAYLAPVLDESLGDRLELLEAAPAAAPALGDPLLAALVQASGHPPVAKLGWTDVAFFAERGVPAANFGPGDPLLAHRDDECVAGDELERCFQVLAGLIAGRGSL